jgi:hypothetical protein
MRSCSDGPARYARFVALGSLRADAGGLTVVDGGRVRRLAWATGLVVSPTSVNDASMAVTASDEASVLFPEPPFCVTNAMVRMFIPSDGIWK